MSQTGEVQRSEDGESVSWPLRVALVGALILTSTLLVVAVVEGTLRLLRGPDAFYPYHRNSVTVFYPSEAITPGITGQSYFTTNEFGTRGPAPDGERVRLLTVGGSTTACTALDDSETWPRLLHQNLNAAVGDPHAFWLTNSGIDGHNSHHHLMHAIHLLPQLQEIDFALYYAGLNDLGMWLYKDSFDPDYLDDPDNWNDRRAEAFRVSHYTPSDRSWYKHLEIWKRASILRNAWSSRQVVAEREDGRIVQDAEFKWVEKERARRKSNEKRFVHRAKMETLPAALDSYGRTLERIVVRTREAGAEPIFMAQAIKSLFLNEEERRQLWMGAMDGGKTYVRVEQMVELIHAYNVRMKEVAERRDVFFIDLPGLLSGDPGLFFDGAHFNEHGAKRTAQVVAETLLASGVLETGRARGESGGRAR